MTSLPDLIARLEAAEEGNITLDDRIALALGWRIDQQDIQGVGKWLAPGESHTQYLPEWSRSIDAALTLVPEGWAIDGWQLWPGATSSLQLLETKLGRDDQYWHSSKHKRFDGAAATPALAICAAALRARLETAGE